MAKLIIRLNGQDTEELTLAEDQEYIGGRGKDADIFIDADHKISRQHFRLFFDGNNWQVEILSRFGELTFEGKQAQNAHLIGECSFQLPPYEFHLIPQEGGDNLPAPSYDVEDDGNLPALADAEFDNDGDDEVTSIGKIEGLPYIRMTDKNNQTTQTLRLEGNFWSAGRDSSAAIHIDDMRVSRNQFQILSTNEGHFIKDLGSVNGTMVNGSPLKPNSPQPLKSGDVISVLDTYLYFEIRDPQFSNKVMQIDPRVTHPVMMNSQMQMQNYMANMPEQNNTQAAPMPPVAQGPYELKIEDFKDGSWKEKMKNLDKKSKFRVAAAVAIVFIMIFNFVPQGAPKPKPEVETGDPFSKLNPKDQEFVKRTYILAKNLYMQGKYKLASSEISKIHEKIPFYEDSEQILEYAAEAIKIREEKEEIERERREKEQLEEEARVIIANCAKEFEDESKADVEAITQCLSPAMDRVGITAEDHPLAAEIQDMIEKVKGIIEERKRVEAEKEDFRRRAEQRKAMYTKAEKLRKEGLPHKAIRQYKRHIASSLPDPENNVARSKRRIAAIEKKVKENASIFIKKSDEFYEQQDLRASVHELDKALRLLQKDDDLENKRLQIINELRKRMQILYQESILEESLGNIESAKDRWHKIIELDVPSGDYHSKSKIKLKKYGDY